DVRYHPKIFALSARGYRQYTPSRFSVIFVQVNLQELRAMKKRLLSAILSAGLFFAAAGTSFAVTQQSRTRYLRHKRHMKTAKRVGIGCPGGAAIVALVGGG